MIRAALLGIFGLGLTAISIAQVEGERDTQPNELEALLFGTDEEGENDTDASDLEAALFGTDEDELVATEARTYQPHETVMLRALDKITGRSTDFEMQVGEPKVYGSLRVDLDACFQTPPEEPPESAAFLRITTATSKQVQSMAVPRELTDEELETSEAEDAEIRFNGWMFASSPGLSALEHPVYDIWVIACSAVDPSTLEPEPPIE